MIKSGCRFFAGCLLLLVSSCPEEQKPPSIHHRQKKINKKPVAKVPVVIQHDTLCIAAVGDIMLGTSYPNNTTLPPDSAKKSFINVKNELRSADVTFGNLEGTLLNGGKPAHYKMHLLSKAYLFRMPESYAGVLKDAGFKVLSLANNHIGDFGDTGRIRTMKVLDSVGIQYGGQVSHPVAIFKINGITYGFCAFAPNAQTLPILHLQEVRETVKDLKQQCDIVIVSFHGGGEGPKFEHVPDSSESFGKERRGNVRAFAHTAINAGADLVFGNGPHVCRGLELYKNRLIAYSLGNFCTYKSVSVAGVCGYAPIVKVHVNKKGEFLNGRIIANKQTHEGGLERDTLNRVVARIKKLTQMDFPKSGLDIGDDGGIMRSPL